MKKILVVDDHVDTTDLVQSILESSGYMCNKANSGMECLDMIRKEKFDLVLLDIAMPQMTGIEVIKKLKEEGFTNINIVLYTASSVSNMETQQLKEIGALDCMKKPFTESELLGIVKKYS